MTATSPARSGDSGPPAGVTLDAGEPGDGGAGAPTPGHEAAEKQEARATHLSYVPALDGIRALAVIAVLLFHSQYSWAKGGFLGVSTFFTLSGFLITSLLLAESATRGRPDLKRFWSRRARRLLPASLLGITLALLATAVIDDPAQRGLFGGDVITSFLDVANWHFYAQGTSYGNLFSDPSALLHFWSLSIEEQFYIFFPPIVFLVSRRWGNRIAFLATFSAMAVGSLGLTLVFSGDPDRVYFGTDTRAVELLAGALLALGVHRFRVLDRKGVVTATRIAGPIALAASMACWAFISQRDDVLYQGGLAAYSLLSVMVVAAAFLSGGWFVAGLAWAPLRQIGRISYGVYVFHWPIFLMISPDRTGLDGILLLLIRLMVTFAIAIASFFLIEQPIRSGEMLKHRPLIPYLAAAVAIATISVILSVTAPANELGFLEGDVGANQRASALQGPAPPAGMPRFGMYGDSTALSVAFGFDRWAVDNRVATPANGITRLGCGLVRSTRVRIGSSETPAHPECLQWHDEWNADAGRNTKTFAVVMVGPWDTGDHLLPGDDTWRGFGDPVFDGAFADEVRAAIEIFKKNGQKTIWLTSPIMTQGKDRDERAARGQSAAPERMRRLNEIVKQVATEQPGWVQVVDLAAWMDQDLERAIALRPDGLHFSNEGAYQAAVQYLGPAIMAAVPTASTTTVAGATSTDRARLCARMSAFGLQELQAAQALTGNVTLQASAAAGLQQAASEVKALSPDLGTSVDARVKYWTAALSAGLKTPPAETAESAAANDKLNAATRSAC